MSVEIDGYAEVWSESIRRARKEHRCDACGETIAVGHRYSYTFSVYERERAETKRCMRCELIYQHLKSRTHAGGFCWEEGVDPELKCGHAYEDVWSEPPPEEIARLAFLTPEEVQQLATKE